jgi:hypothetical protein
MDVSELCQLLSNTDQFEIEYLVVEDNEIRVGMESTALDSQYLRYPRDLA